MITQNGRAYDTTKIIDYYKSFERVMADIKSIDSVHNEIFSMQNIDPDLSWQELGDNIADILERLTQRNILPESFPSDLKKLFSESERYTTQYVKSTLPVLDNLNTKKEAIIGLIQKEFNSIPEGLGIIVSGVCLRLQKIEPNKVDFLINELTKIKNKVILNKNNGYIHIYTDNQETSSDIKQQIMMASLKLGIQKNISELRTLNRNEMFQLLVLKHDRNKIIIGSSIDNIILLDDLKIKEFNEIKSSNINNKNNHTSNKNNKPM